MDSQEPLELIATCAFGLEAVVGRELTALGYESQVLQTGRLLFHGGLEDVARANLHLRTAERVLIRLATWAANDFDLLFDGVGALPWEEWIPSDGCFPVKARTYKSQLTSVPAIQRSVKKAIVNRLTERCRRLGQADNLPETGPVFAVEAAIRDDAATITIDTTGESLHKRGYRKLTGEAPLRETLAAALVMLSFWRPERPLLDPFCGTGTIPIEAAMLGRNMAPGLRREFVSEAWPQFQAGAIWATLRSQAESEILPALPQRLIATDASADALKMARYHAQLAGVEQDIHWQQREFADLSSKREYGCLITNPPYGRRLGEDREVEQLLSTFPLVLRRLPTWSHFIISPHPRFERVMGQQADRRRKLYNGRIECQYYQYHGPRPPRSSLPAADHAEARAADASDRTAPTVESSVHLAPPAPPAPPAQTAPARVFGGLVENAERQAGEFRNRLAKRARHLRRWPKRGITCYRLYERDVPEVPLVIDRYEDHLYIAEFDRPHERTPAEHADWLDLMARTAAETLGTPLKNVHLKRRQRQRSTAQYEKLDDRGERIIVHEGGLKFWVNLDDYLDTGLFLDHRMTRDMVRQACSGKRFLNLFAYTGSFTVYAADGGAVATTTVDLSRNYLNWADENLNANGFTGEEHALVRADTLPYLRSLPREPLFDVVVADPPTYSNSKSTERDWDVQRDYIELLNEIAPRLSEDGVVFFSTNFRRFKFDPDAIQLTSREISKQTVPNDFRNRRIHRCWRLTHGMSVEQASSASSPLL